MNINEILTELSACSDHELLLIAKSGIARFVALLAKVEHTELLQKRKRNQRCASVTLFAKSSGKSIFDSNTSEKLTSYPYDQNLFETQNLIESVYKKLISKYKETSWVRGDLKPEIHVAALKQFWLDCYVADGNFMALLLAALQGKVWVGLNGFKKALESTRGVSAFAMFSLKRYDKKLQQHFLTQKMIFFFAFGQFEFGIYITRQNLVKILTLVNIKDNTQLHIWADHLISGANKAINSGKDFIGFPEFFKFITS